MTKSLLIVLTGKTASGKDTIQSKLRQKYPNLHRIITSTSRVIRPGEKKDVDYHFYSRAEFKAKVETGDFVEWVEYGTNLYGTEKKELAAALTEDCIWRIDPSRAGETRDFIKRAFDPTDAEKLLSNLVVLYITTDQETILKRLQGRRLPAAEIEGRMKDDEMIWQEYKDKYDYVIENTPGKLDETVDKIINIISTNHETA